MNFIELLAGPYDGMTIAAPDVPAIRFRGRLFLYISEFNREGLPIFWDAGREFHALMDGVTDVEPGRL
jgi:hypothetical protein